MIKSLAKDFQSDNHRTLISGSKLRVAKSHPLRGGNMGRNDFDRIVRENAKHALHRHLGQLEIQPQVDGALPTNFTGTFENKVDFLYRAREEAGKEVLIHFEYQTKDDPNMIYRMQRYHALINYEHKKKILPFVVYLGAKDSKMTTKLPDEQVFRGFHQISLKDEPLSEFLASDRPEDIVLGILSDFEGQNANKSVELLYTALQQHSQNENDFTKYLNQLAILSRLRNLESVVDQTTKRMGSSIDWSDFYPVLEAREEGREEGIEEGEERGIKKGIEKGKYELLMKLISKGTMTIEQAAKEMKISLQEMKQKIEELKKE